MAHFIDSISIDSLLKAAKTFERFRTNMVTDRDKAGGIQAFEFTYELAWKTMKRILAQRGVEVASPRDCIRQAAKNGLISNPEVWFKFIELRNVTTHTYNEETVLAIVDHFDEFSQALKELITNLEKSA